MAINPQKQAAKQFVEYWTFNRPGSEKSGCQQYWNMLLGLGDGVAAFTVPSAFSHTASRRIRRVI